jgi:hypothetical protein
MRPYQLRASHKVFTGTGDDGTAVILDMGLGKTIIVLNAIAELINWNVIKRPVLIVAPIAVVNTVWKQEAAAWSSTKFLKINRLRGAVWERQINLHRPAHVYLINPELLMWLYEELGNSWAHFDMLVIDESSKFKNPKSKCFRVLSNYGRRDYVRDDKGKLVRDEHGDKIRVGPHRFKRVAIMTGTPAPTSLLNMWAPMYLVDHGKRLHTQYDTYQDRYFHRTMKVATETWKMEVNKDEFEVRPDWMPKDGAPTRIHELVADVTVELNGEDFDVLPATIGDASKGEVAPSNLHEVDLPADIRAVYDHLEKHALVELEQDFIMAANGGAKSMMCHQIANGFLYQTNDFGEQRTELMHTAKLEKLIDLIETLDTNVVVTFHFKADKERIINALHQAGISYCVLTAANSAKVLPVWNNGSIRVMLLHPQSAGHGINAQYGGHTIIWYSQIWSLEQYMQTNARLARSGQQEIVGIHHIVARNTVDNLMLMTYLERGDNQNKFRQALRKYQELRGWSINQEIA